MSDFFHRAGIRSVNVGFRKEDIAVIQDDWKEYVEGIPAYPDTFDGRGIVICAGGVKYFTCCWVLINILRKELKCTLPIQVWYVGDELIPAVIKLLNDLDVSCHDFLDYEKDLELEGWMLKPLSILLSSFKEVMYLDADNTPVLNPEFLFEHSGYKKYGAMFWPDFWSTDLNNQIWEITGCEPVLMKEQESGQLLINKEQCWRELNLALYFNRTHYIYYNLLLGDKDTFRFAWMALNSPFYYIEQEPSCCGYKDEQGIYMGNTMVQYTPDGEMCFLHRNLQKWNVNTISQPTWQLIKKFSPGAIRKEYIIYSASIGEIVMNLEGDIEEVLFESALGELEYTCFKYLNDLGSLKEYQNFIKILSPQLKNDTL